MMITWKNGQRYTSVKYKMMCQLDGDAESVKYVDALEEILRFNPGLHETLDNTNLTIYNIKFIVGEFKKRKNETSNVNSMPH